MALLDVLIFAQHSGTSLIGSIQSRLEEIADTLGAFRTRIGEIKDSTAATISGIEAQQRRAKDNLQIIRDCQQILRSVKKKNLLERGSFGVNCNISNTLNSFENEIEEGLRWSRDPRIWSLLLGPPMV